MTESTARPTSSLAGIFPIPVTTFDMTGNLDVDGLRRQVEFCLEAGAHGILYPGVVSEFYTLTDAERRLAVETCVEAVGGRVPVAVGVSAASTQSAADFARHAASLDAAAIMAMTPFVQHFFAPTVEYSVRHVAAIAEAAPSTAVILQNARIGSPLPISAIPALIKAVPQVRYVKQETNPSTQAITDVLDVVGDQIDGVFAGLGGIYLVNELDRGAVGSMPAPALVDHLVRAYDLYRADDDAAAQRELDGLGSLFARELLYNVAFIKELLVRRGVISHNTVRIASPSLDRHDHADLDRMMSSVGSSA